MSKINEIIKCPNCGQAQPVFESMARLKIWFNRRPVQWNCEKCKLRLAFTKKGISFFWGVCFSITFVIISVIFFILIKVVFKREALEGMETIFVLLVLLGSLPLTFLISIPFKERVYKIDIIDKK